MHDRPILIIGGGGHTRVLLGMLKQNGATVRGIVTQDTARVGERLDSVPILRVEPVRDDPASVALVNGVGNKPSRSDAGLGVRRALFERYRQQGYQFASIVSRAAIVQPEVQLGEGCQLMPGAVVQPGAVIGANCIVNTGAIIEHDAQVGDHSHIAPGAILCGGAVIGRAVHVGAGAIVLQGVRVGDGAIIGAGAVVGRDVAAGQLVRPAASRL